MWLHVCVYVCVRAFVSAVPFANPRDLWTPLCSAIQTLCITPFQCRMAYEALCLSIIDRTNDEAVKALRLMVPTSCLHS